MADGRRDNLGPDLSAYLDGELPKARAREIEQLMAEQPDLRAELEQLRATSAQLVSLPHLPAPVGLGARMRERGESHAPRTEPAKLELRPTISRAGRRARVFRMAVQVSAAAAVLLGGALIGWQVLSRERATTGRRTETPVSNVAIADKQAPAPSADELDETVVGSRLVRAPRTTPTDAAQKDEGGPGPGGTPAVTQLRAPVVAERAEPAGTPTLGKPQPRPSEAVEPGTVADGSTPDALGAPGYVAGGSAQKQRRLWVSTEAAASSAPATPIVDVQITPQSPEQYAAACGVLERFGLATTPPEDAQRGEVVGREVAELTPQSCVQFVRLVPATEATALVSALDSEAPRQVALEIKAGNLDLLRTLVRASEPHPPESAPSIDVWHSTEAPVAPGAAPRSPRVAQPSPAVAPPTSTERSKVKDNARETRAPREKEKPKPQGAIAGGGRSSGAKSKVGPAERSAARNEQPEEKAAFKRTETAPAARRGAGPAQVAQAPPAAAPAQPATGSPPAPPIIRAIVAGWQWAARNLSPVTAVPQNQQITLRVTLLPPPAQAATQPASAPSGPP